MNDLTEVLGTVAMVPKGEYDSSAYYEYLNVVTYEGSTYMAKKAVNNVLPTDEEYWQFIAGGLERKDASLVFDTVADMKADDTLKDGMYAQTMGYYAANDGGHGEYVIVDDDTLVDDGGSIHVLTNGLRAKLIVNDIINVKQFGAYGDAINNDTQSIQKALDYALPKGLNVKVPSTNNYYLITSPLILTSNRSVPVGYWGGGASSIYGEDKAKSRIVKIGNTKIDDKDVTLLCKNSIVSANSGTGITIKNLSIENYDDTSFNKTSGYAIDINISRSTLKDLNIVAYSGIIATIFSSKFENIVYNCNEKALDLSEGTSNLFRFMYAPRCTNPYKISSSYSTLMNVCCDGGKGTIFKISGMGLELNSCGCESPNAQYIFEIINDYTTVSINDFFMHRQIGDEENSLSLSDCGILHTNIKSVVDINNFSIAEFNQLSGTSYFFVLDNDGVVFITTSIKNLRYYKNYSGTNNDKLKLWNKKPGLQCVQRLSTPTQDFNYLVGTDLHLYPYIGGYYLSNPNDPTMGGVVNDANLSSSKTIWLDCKDKYHTESGQEIRYMSQHNVGDIQLYNDPLGKNSLGLVVTESVNSYTWNTKEIPLVLAGTTAERPTTNLFVGLQYFDTTLNKPIWYNGSAWRDSSGNSV